MRRCVSATSAPARPPTRSPRSAAGRAPDGFHWGSRTLLHCQFCCPTHHAGGELFKARLRRIASSLVHQPFFVDLNLMFRYCNQCKRHQMACRPQTSRRRLRETSLPWRPLQRALQTVKTTMYAPPPWPLYHLMHTSSIAVWCPMWNALKTVLPEQCEAKIYAVQGT